MMAARDVRPSSTTSTQKPWVAAPGFTTRPYLMPACSRLHIQPAAMPARQASTIERNTSPSGRKSPVEIRLERLVERAPADAPR